MLLRPSTQRRCLKLHLTCAVVVVPLSEAVRAAPMDGTISPDLGLPTRRSHAVLEPTTWSSSRTQRQRATLFPARLVGNVDHNLVTRAQVLK